MSIIRAILNNGFFIIVLIVAATLYLAYSDNIKEDHGLLDEETHEQDTTPKPKELTNLAPKASEQAPEIKSEDKVEKNPTLPTEKLQNASTDKTPTESPNTDAKLTENQSDKATEQQANATYTEQALALNTEADTNEVTAEKTSDEAKKEATEKVTTEVTEKANTEMVAESDPMVAPQQKAEENIEAKTNISENTVETPEGDSEAVVNKKPVNPSVLTAELDKILDAPTDSAVIPNFTSEQEALTFANQAMQEGNFETAAKIYFDVSTKSPSANVTGLLAKALYLGGKKGWADKAWLESAQLLVKENRLPEASMLASRLMAFSPQVGQEIQKNLYQIRQKQMQKMRAQGMKPMPPMNQIAPMPQQNMKPMPPMNQMAPMPPQNMKPMPPMNQMAPMPPQNMKPMPPMNQMAPMPSQNMKPMPPMNQMAPMPPQNMKPMPPMNQMAPMPPQNMKPMPPMNQMAPMPPQNMKPMPPMNQMAPMPPQNMQPMPSLNTEKMSFKQPMRPQYYRNYVPRQSYAKAPKVIPRFYRVRSQPHYRNYRKQPVANYYWPRNTPWNNAHY